MTSSHVLSHRQMRQDAIHLFLGQVPRVPVAVKSQEAANPVHIGLLRTSAVMPGSQEFHHAVVKPGRRLPWEQPQRPYGRQHQVDYNTPGRGLSTSFYGCAT